MAQTSSRPWIVNAWFDLSIFVGPILIGLVTVIAWSTPYRAAVGSISVVAALMLIMVLVDLPHVWVTIYRSYLDPEEVRRRPNIFVRNILFILLGLVLLAWWSTAAVFCVLAYYVYYHLVRQNWGYIALYRHNAAERRGFDQKLDQWVCYVSGFYPLLWWHFNQPRGFDLWTKTDFFDPRSLMATYLPSVSFESTHFVVSTVLLIVSLGILTVWLGRQVSIWLTNRRFNVGKIMVMLGSWATFYLGIIVFNDLIAFTLFVVAFHGVPYIAIIGLYLRNRGRDSRWQQRPRLLGFLLSRSTLVPAYLFIVAICVVHGLSWDFFIFRQFFSGPEFTAEGTRLLEFLLLPVLALPHATHYHLDSEIWRFDDRNPNLREYLNLKKGYAMGSPIGTAARVISNRTSSAT